MAGRNWSHFYSKQAQRRVLVSEEDRTVFVERGQEAFTLKLLGTHSSYRIKFLPAYKIIVGRWLYRLVESLSFSSKCVGSISDFLSGIIGEVLSALAGGVIVALGCTCFLGVICICDLLTYQRFNGQGSYAMLGVTKAVLALLGVSA